MYELRGFLIFASASVVATSSALAGVLDAFLVGVLVAFDGDEAVARATAMQIAAMRPQYVNREDIPAEAVESERRIAEATAREEGKPEAALEKIVEGRINGFYKEVVLLEQSSVQDSKKTVRAVLTEANTTVSRFARFEVGA